MSTRALVGILNENMVTYIYNHFDGYPECLGKTLVENYRTREIVEELLSFGDASYIEESANKSEFYMRDKGETDCEARVVGAQEYIEKEWFCDFKYLFNGEWLVMEENDKNFKPVMLLLIKGEEND
jgi:hypothetical protein